MSLRERTREIFSFPELIDLIPSLPVKEVLDLGCGRGQVTARLSRSGLNCIGIDPSLKFLTQAKSFAPVVLATGDNLPFIKSCFDIVILKEVIHHLSHPREVLAEARRCLKPGGFLWVLEPVEDDPILRFGRNLHPYWQGVKVETRLYSQDLIRLIRDSGFSIIKSGGVEGGFPNYLFFWSAQTIYLCLQAMKVPWLSVHILRGILKSKFIMDCDPPLLYYWCLAKKEPAQ
ncbi:MAG: class I SAM-dependent methyltransferase [Chloroflexota bacterium]